MSMNALCDLLHEFVAESHGLDEMAFRKLVAMYEEDLWAALQRSDFDTQMPPHEDTRMPPREDACCDNERRNMNGGCDNCGDPCF